MPWDEKFTHIELKRILKTEYSPSWDVIIRKLEKKEIFWKIYISKYFYLMQNERKIWKTDLYEYIIFWGLKWLTNKKKFAFLKFKNTDDFIKWKKSKKEKEYITKIYKLQNWTVQANVLLWWNIYQDWRVIYFNGYTEIWIWKASQLNLC